MERKSSIHIEKAKPGEFFHNDRTKPTANSIFSVENNFCNLSGLDAINLYKKDIKEKTKIYTEKTGKKLNKNTITLLSAIVNLDKQHTKEDLEKICKYLEQSLGTKIYQYAIHKDEGWIDEETGEKHINYHAHILFSGLDYEGRSVRKKLTRSYLINLQSKVAEILGMQRGINYTKERKKRPKRLDTYEYKEHARRKEKEVKELKKELAKVKDLKEENKRLRALLKELGAKREDYAELESFIKQLKEQIKNKELSLKELKEKVKEYEEKKEEERKIKLILTREQQIREAEQVAINDKINEIRDSNNKIIDTQINLNSFIEFGRFEFDKYFYYDINNYDINDQQEELKKDYDGIESIKDEELVSKIESEIFESDISQYAVDESLREAHKTIANCRSRINDAERTVSEIESTIQRIGGKIQQITQAMRQGMQQGVRIIKSIFGKKESSISK
jgi:hypothetical protein